MLCICSDILNKLINSENTFLKVLFNQFPHFLRKCLIFIYWRVSVQFVTPTSQFTPFESNGLVYKPHPRFLTQNFGKKVRLIHKFLQ